MPSPAQATLRFMTIFFGANDACLPGTQTGQHVPRPQYRQNLTAILEHPTLNAQKPRVILITPPPVDEYRLEECDREKGIQEIRRTAEHTKLYAEACRETGKEHNVVVLDLWSVFMGEAGWKDGMPLIGSKKVERSEVLGELLHDGRCREDSSTGLTLSTADPTVVGLHFNPKAYKILFQAMIDTIAQHWPDQTVERVPFVQPAWEIAPK
ncbi:MAG: hypothetical protein M1830_009430 [Pleopsidium flavum]|nr:MAG: hypothetical protein M1830_009430 [Pleopsidium flavum]